MEINKANLITALKIIQPGITKKSPVEQMSHSIFSGKYLTSFNSQVSVLYPFETEFKSSVNADDLMKIVRKIDKSTVKIGSKDGKFTIHAPGTRALLMTPLENDLETQIKSMTDQIPDSGKRLPKDFSMALNACIFSAAAESTNKGSLTCIKIKNDCMMSCDGARASYVQMEGPMEEMLLRAKTVEGLVDFQPIAYHVSKSWVHFVNAKQAFYNVKLVNGLYPEETIVNALNFERGHELKLPFELKKMIDSIIPMAEGDLIQKTVKIIIDDYKVTCEAEKESGKIEKSMEIEYGGGRISFLINPKFLSQILEKMNICTYTDGKILFVNNNIKHVILLKITG